MEESKVFRFRSRQFDLEEIQNHLSACILISRDHSLVSLRPHVERAFVEAHFSAIETHDKLDKDKQTLNGELAGRYGEMLHFMETEFLGNGDAFIAYLLGIARQAVTDKYPHSAKGPAQVINLDAKG